ncbi:MAG: twin-arginine translocase TatA/TatE family subunit [Planctomycetota bacterium]|jgi:sec-independent protein translocase protein TatA
MDNGFVLALFGSFGPAEILLILAIILLLFGASRIPEVARSLGKGVDEFKKGLRGEGESEDRGISGRSRESIEDKGEDQGKE